MWKNKQDCLGKKYIQIERPKKLKIQHRRKQIYKRQNEKEDSQGRQKSNDRKGGRKPGECSVKEAS